jgi:type II secretory pathway component PulM|tara:strand:+ start:171 stop:599 length:429 start_codon:yes stop_codon:yes gene_type:complete
MAILLLTGFLLVFSVFQFALMPMSENRAQMALNNGAASAQLSRVEAKVSRLLSLRDAGSTGQNDNLSSTLSAAAQNAGLTVKRLQPNSRGEVQVRFEGADFDALLQWLQTVEGNEGLRIIDASVSDAGRSGGVNATLRVRGQ